MSIICDNTNSLEANSVPDIQLWKLPVHIHKPLRKQTVTKYRLPEGNLYEFNEILLNAGLKKEQPTNQAAVITIL